MNNRKGLQLAYLVVGSLTVLEFLFVRGVFTWLIAISAITVLGIVNVFSSIKDHDVMEAALYVLSTIALCMGYTLFL